MKKISEIRKSFFGDKYVIFAPKRSLRPHKISEEEAKRKEQFKENCFFCPSPNEERAIYQIDASGKWLVKVVENKFPALSLSNPKAYGKQEIVIDTPNHGEDFCDLSPEHIRTILDVYAARIKSINELENINYVQVFKNDGGKAGASIPHAHSQIIGLEFIPHHMMTDTLAMDKYFCEKGSCAYCDIIHKEQKEKERIVFEDANVVAFCPWASSSPFALWILPKAHKNKLEDLTPEERLSVAEALKLATSKLDKEEIPYNFFIHDSLPHNDHHFRLKIASRMNVWGGFEIGSGVIINPVFPEDAAMFYKG
ncbi:MAG: Galactose-1-phosphate uridylyltransferase [candidate division CPR2 bacterium GW2011_GWC1_39_9]|uniref:Galactose-1-phosphate uridylyltransferase n=1 Tax=candidate division CPR2 bacterium GW2011_GWC2_39_10 TaxID=1618345 RepID=A0A0G0LS29_UNCC2|nr:MAG: Galactose-1-phosphate uridylyltransferase [candidate division CPR2 bacterium GW2011_GWC2_39_10]KKR35426.1 MAG: Galactose-1-phosphate uridylyltransferase [candidate division CPR2 bacterium GW2011_GWC1_39_9]